MLPNGFVYLDNYVPGGGVRWDAYRPQSAVDNFVRWTESEEPDYRKALHHPNIDKKDMIEYGYITKKSGHSRGSSIDLTLYTLDTKKLLRMDGYFDLMDEASHHGAAGISAEATKNRALFRGIMENNGFKALKEEWWHYTLEKEPYQNEYFNFPIS